MSPPVTQPITKILPRLDAPPHRAPWLEPAGKVEVKAVFAPPPACHLEPTPEQIAELDQLRKAAEEAGLRAAQDKVEKVIQRYMEGLGHLQEKIRAAGRPLASEVVSLALVAAQAIVEHEITLDREIVVRAIEDALRSVSLDMPVTVRLRPTEASYLRQRRPDLLEAGVKIIEDSSLGVGGCKVETPHLVIDACLEARLEAVRGALAEVLSEAGDDVLGSGDGDWEHRPDDPGKEDSTC